MWFGAVLLFVLACGAKDLVAQGVPGLLNTSPARTIAEQALQNMPGLANIPGFNEFVSQSLNKQQTLNLPGFLPDQVTNVPGMNALQNAMNNIPVASVNNLPGFSAMPATYGVPGFNQNDNVCYRDVSKEVPYAMVSFDASLFKTAAKLYNNHFVLSEYSVWLTMAAFAEGAPADIQEKMFNILHLPKEPCLRLKYYEQAKRHERPGSDLKVFRTRLFALDDGLTLNQTWSNGVRNYGLLNVVSMPIISNPEYAAEQLSKLSQSRLNELRLSGNSILLDTFDYNGLWTSAFPNAVIEHDKPFYNEVGEKIGTIDYLRIRQRVKLAYLPELHTKVIELPVGFVGQYGLLFFLPTDELQLSTFVNSIDGAIINSVYDNLKESLIPFDITVPRFKLSSYHDLRGVLEELGIKDLWHNAAATEYISHPPAMPNAYMQRVTVELDVDGLQKMKEELFSNLGLQDTGLPPLIGRSFLVNRPFVFAFINAQTRTCMFAGIYSNPSI